MTHFFMREWLSGRASPCQGEGREFESRLALFISGEGKKEASNMRCASFFVPVICLVYKKTKIAGIFFVN